MMLIFRRLFVTLSRLTLSLFRCHILIDAIDSLRSPLLIFATFHAIRRCGMCRGAKISEQNDADSFRYFLAAAERRCLRCHMLPPCCRCHCDADATLLCYFRLFYADAAITPPLRQV
jgi:hypothetical protein